MLCARRAGWGFRDPRHHESEKLIFSLPQVEAVESFDADDEEEISFSKGDRLLLVDYSPEVDDEEWVVGQHLGKKEKGLGKMGGAGETTTMEVAAARGGGGGAAAAGAPGAAVVAAPGGGGGGLATAATTVTASAGAGAGVAPSSGMVAGAAFFTAAAAAIL